MTDEVNENIPNKTNNNKTLPKTVGVAVKLDVEVYCPVRISLSLANITGKCCFDLICCYFNIIAVDFKDLK